MFWVSPFDSVRFQLLYWNEESHKSSTIRQYFLHTNTKIEKTKRNEELFSALCFYFTLCNILINQIETRIVYKELKWTHTRKNIIKILFQLQLFCCYFWVFVLKELLLSYMFFCYSDYICFLALFSNYDTILTYLMKLASFLFPFVF